MFLYNKNSDLIQRQNKTDIGSILSVIILNTLYLTRASSSILMICALWVDLRIDISHESVLYGSQIHNLSPESKNIILKSETPYSQQITPCSICHVLHILLPFPGTQASLYFIFLSTAHSDTENRTEIHILPMIYYNLP